MCSDCEHDAILYLKTTCSAPVKVCPAFRSNLFAPAYRRERKKDFHCNQVYERSAVLLLTLSAKSLSQNRRNAETRLKSRLLILPDSITVVYPKKHAVTYQPEPEYSDCCWFQIKGKIISVEFYHIPRWKQAAA